MKAYAKLIKVLFGMPFPKYRVHAKQALWKMQTPEKKALLKQKALTYQVRAAQENPLEKVL